MRVAFLRNLILGVSACFALCAGPSARGQVIGYAVNSGGDDNLYSIDLQTGVTTLIGPVGFSDVDGLSFNRETLVLYGIDEDTDQLITINTDTGAGTTVGSLGRNLEETGLTFDDAGNLYASGEDLAFGGNPGFGEGQFFRINPVTGAAARVGPIGFDVEGLASVGGTVYGVTDDSNGAIFVSIDPATGAATFIGETTLSFPDELGADADYLGRIWGVDERTGSVFRIDNLATGQAEIIFESIPEFEGAASGLAIFPQPVPGPGALVLFGGGGAAGMALLARRRARRS